MATNREAVKSAGPKGPQPGAAVPADGLGVPETRPFENLLRRDPELLRSLVDQAADCVCLHEVDGRILDVNQRICTTLGYSRDELLALTVFDIDATATAEDAAAAALDLAPGAHAVGERLLKRKDGSTLPVELRLSILVSGDRQLMLGLARDITDRKCAELVQEEAQRALEHRVRERTEHLEIVNHLLEEDIRARQRSEVALRDSEGRFRELAERGHLLAWEADARSWLFTYVGPQAPDLLGYPVEEWYRPGFWVDRIRANDRERDVENCSRHSNSAPDNELEYRKVAADGRVVWFQDIVHVIRDEAGMTCNRAFKAAITSLQKTLRRDRRLPLRAPVRRDRRASTGLRRRGAARRRADPAAPRPAIVVLPVSQDDPRTPRPRAPRDRHGPPRDGALRQADRDRLLILLPSRLSPPIRPC